MEIAGVRVQTVREMAEAEITETVAAIEKIHDKVQKVKDFMLKNAELSAKNNGHWMDILDEYIWTGVDLQTGYKAAVEALTPARLAAHLKQLVAAGNHAEVVMTPGK